VVTDNINMAKEVDLLIDVCPTINLEWVQKIRRDMAERGYHREAVLETIHIGHGRIWSSRRRPSVRVGKGR
jgi:phosphoribulokinase